MLLTNPSLLRIVCIHTYYKKLRICGGWASSFPWALTYFFFKKIILHKENNSKKGELKLHQYGKSLKIYFVGKWRNPFLRTRIHLRTDYTFSPNPKTSTFIVLPLKYISAKFILPLNYIPFNILRPKFMIY